MGEERIDEVKRREEDREVVSCLSLWLFLAYRELSIIMFWR